MLRLEFLRSSFDLINFVKGCLGFVYFRKKLLENSLFLMNKLQTLVLLQGENFSAAYLFKK